MRASVGDLQPAEGVDAVLALPDLALVLDADVAELVLVVLHVVADADVVPHDGVRERLARLAAPDDGRLALVRDACVRA